MKVKNLEVETFESETSDVKQRKFGNVPGSRFYDRLTYKRVKGKMRVRGASKITADQYQDGISPERWKENKLAEKNKTHENKTQTTDQ